MNQVVDPVSAEFEKTLLRYGEKIQQVRQEIKKKIVGQDAVSDRLLMALICGGHVLLEGLPGLAKTTTINALAQTCHLAFKRIQFTPDLLPADVLGTQIYEPKSGDFKVKKGPVFTNLLLADEINRAPAKVQSALLECMQEQQVTLGDQTFILDKPFMVLATQNPIEQEGTYPLPEAQVDRFLFKVKVSYGNAVDEVEIMRRAMQKTQPSINAVIDANILLEMQQALLSIHVADKVRSYIVDLVFATREPRARLKELEKLIEIGASPRASIFLEKAARANALFEGRSFVTPQDVKSVALDVLRHRITPTFEAEADNISTDHIVTRLLEGVDVP